MLTHLFASFFIARSFDKGTLTQEPKKNMKVYIARVKHDRGSINLKVTARTKQGAIRQIMEAERCPRRAIYEIWAQAVELGRLRSFK